MNVYRDRLNAMFSRFESSALATFVAGCDRAILNPASETDLSEIREIARSEGIGSVGDSEFAEMVANRTKRHGLTPYEIGELFGEHVRSGDLRARDLTPPSDDLLVINLPDAEVSVTEWQPSTMTLTSAAVLAWLDNHEPGPNTAETKSKSGEYLGVFTRPGDVDLWLYCQFEASTSVNAVRVALALAGRYRLRAVYVKHFESGSMIRIAGYTENASEL